MWAFCFDLFPSFPAARELEDLLVLTEPLFERDVDEGREQEVTREELLMLAYGAVTLNCFRWVVGWGLEVSVWQRLLSCGFRFPFLWLRKWGFATRSIHLAIILTFNSQWHTMQVSALESVESGLLCQIHIEVLLQDKRWYTVVWPSTSRCKMT